LINILFVTVTAAKAAISALERAYRISLHSSESGKFTVAIFGRERRTGSKRRQKRAEEPGGVSQRSRGKI